MPFNTAWPKKLSHTHTFYSHQNYACRILQISANSGCTKPLDPCSVLQENQPTWILHISHPLTTYQHIPSCTIINHQIPSNTIRYNHIQTMSTTLHLLWQTRLHRFFQRLWICWHLVVHFDRRFIHSLKLGAGIAVEDVENPEAKTTFGEETREPVRVQL